MSDDKTTTKKMPGQLTEISKGRVKFTRKAWAFFVAETDRVLGLSLHDMAPGKGAVSMPLEVHLFMLSVIEAAVEYSGADLRRAGGGGGGCCEEKCRGFGGCDYEYGTIAVCNEGDLFVCDV